MNRVEQIHQQIRELQEELLSIQEACCHPLICTRYKHESSTGNWDPTMNCYWTKVRCTLCTKRWIVEESVLFDAPAVQVKREEEL